MRILQGISCIALLSLLLMFPAACQKKELPKSKIGKDGAEMILIPAGEFQMGGNDGEPGEKSARIVYLDAFYIDKHEVTNAQYQRFVQATGHRKPEEYVSVHGVYGILVRIETFKPWSDARFMGDDHPVVCVSWEDAKAYAKWAGKRLPTVAEWEKAARGGLEGKRYPWGDDWPPPPKAGNFADEIFKKAFPEKPIIPGYDDGHAYPAPVGSFAPNGYGLYDMAGNVWEWCADWYDSDYYAKSPKESSKKPGSGKFRSCGGSFSYNDSLFLRAAFHFIPIYMLSEDGGFRCVRNP